jgi:histidine triad (HIT) family protein
MCKICDMIKTRYSIVYDDNYVICAVSTERAAKGHLIVAPKMHFTIMELVPEEVLSRCFLVADRIAMILAESIEAAGYNLLINNGSVANQTDVHFSINIIPRRIDDGISFDWQKISMDNDMLIAAEHKIKLALESVERKHRIEEDMHRFDREFQENKEDSMMRINRNLP